MFILCYTLQGYSNEVPILKVYIQKWEKYCGNLGVYNIRFKGFYTYFREERPYKLGYLYQPSV